MTEDQIECRAERMMDRLDMRFLGGTLSQAEYDLEVRKIQQWVDEESRKARTSEANRQMWALIRRGQPS